MPGLMESDGDGEDADDEPADDINDFGGVEESDAEKEKTAKVGSADLGLGDDNGIVSGFDGVEDEKGDEESGEESGGGSGGGSSGDPTIQSAIENGLAEVAAVGLEGEEREQVTKEMGAIAEKFKVGYFGEQVAQKYLKRDIEDIPPEYGLVAALIAFGAIAVYKRPDGEERVQHAVSIVKERMSGGGGEEPVRQPPPDPRPSRQPQQPQQSQQSQEPQQSQQSQEPVAEVDEPPAEAQMEAPNE